MFNIFKNNCCHAPKECDLVQELRQVREELKDLRNTLNLHGNINNRFYVYDNKKYAHWELSDIFEWLKRVNNGTVDPIITIPGYHPYNSALRPDTFNPHCRYVEILRQIAKFINTVADIKEKNIEIEQQIKELKNKEQELKKQLGIS